MTSFIYYAVFTDGFSACFSFTFGNIYTLFLWRNCLGFFLFDFFLLQNFHNLFIASPILESFEALIHWKTINFLNDHSYQNNAETMNHEVTIINLHKIIIQITGYWTESCSIDKRTRIISHLLLSDNIYL